MESNGLSANGRGCVKTISSEFGGLNRSKKRDSMQISDLLINQALADFT